MVGTDPARIHVALSRGVRGRSFLAELSSSPGWRRSTERRIAWIGSYRDGGGPYFCSSAASSLSKNADHDRCSARRGAAGDGRRAGTGDATRPLDSHDRDQFLENLPAALDGLVVCGVSND